VESTLIARRLAQCPRPPVGVGYYAACVIGRVDPGAAMRDIWPYLGALLIGLLIVAAVPWFSTGFLPH
jgi:TRAP-type C4-dicarboxylate transport system permease large subunit